MRPTNKEEFARLMEALAEYESEVGQLKGVQGPGARESLAEQIIESERRNWFVEHLRNTTLSESRKDPKSELFDPIRASIILRREGAVDEAFWMNFLYTHFGKHRKSGFGYSRAIYGALGSNTWWTWGRVSSDVSSFRSWLQENKDGIRQFSGPGGFGNHRKYESLDGWSDKGTGAVVESYVDWVGPAGHAARISDVIAAGGATDPFDSLYRSMDEVSRFGRTARFDYLMMANKTGLIEARPTHAYLTNATGPLRGARLLVTGDLQGAVTVGLLDSTLSAVQRYLGVGFDVLEDAICNWQKSPNSFKPFRG